MDSFESYDALIKEANKRRVPTTFFCKGDELKLCDSFQGISRYVSENYHITIDYTQEGEGRVKLVEL